MSQLAYNLYQNQGTPGLKEDSRYDLVGAGLVEAGNGPVLFGTGVILGTPATQDNSPVYKDSIIVTTAGADAVIYGIALKTHATEQGFDKTADPSSTGAQYEELDSASILRRGSCWVVVAAGAAPTFGADAYTAANGEFTQVAATNVVGTFKSGVVAYNATTNIALLEINNEGL